MKLFTFQYIHTDQSAESQVKFSISYLKKLKPFEIGNLKSQAIFLFFNTHACNVVVTNYFS